MRNIALKLMYNGAGYHGWQVQKNASSVCETLEKAIGKLKGQQGRSNEETYRQVQQAKAAELEDVLLAPDMEETIAKAALKSQNLLGGNYKMRRAARYLTDPDFGLPEYYDIQAGEGRIAARIHHSRMIRFTGRELPCLERLAELYWGASEVESLYREVVQYDNTTANMAALTFRANVDTMEVANLEQLFSVTSGEAQRRFWATVQAQSTLKSNFGMQLVNRGDKITNTQYTFTGLSDVHESMCLSLSGASRIPMTKLFGRSPAGMNATGENDLRNYFDYIDTLRESKLAPILRRLLPILAMSELGAVPKDLDISFPPLWTPKATEVAEIAKNKAEAIIAVFQAGLLRADTAQRELKKLSAETDLFDSISDEEIAANKGKTYQDVTSLHDPLAGLTLPPSIGGDDSDEEDDGPFEQATGDALALDFNPHHDPASGRFTSGGGSGTMGKTKYAPSPQRNKSGIQLKPKKYARLCGILGTRFPGLEAGEVRKIRDAKNEYLIKADGYGGMQVLKINPVK